MYISKVYYCICSWNLVHTLDCTYIQVPVCVGGLQCVGMYMAKVNISATMMALLFEVQIY